MSKRRSASHPTVELVGGARVAQRSRLPCLALHGGYMSAAQLAALQAQAATDAIVKQLLEERADRACEPDSRLGALLDRGLIERLPARLSDPDSRKAYADSSNIIHNPANVPLCRRGEPNAPCGNGASGGPGPTTVSMRRAVSSGTAASSTASPLPQRSATTSSATPAQSPLPLRTLTPATFMLPPPISLVPSTHPAPAVALPAPAVPAAVPAALPAVVPNATRLTMTQLLQRPVPTAVASVPVPAVATAGVAGPPLALRPLQIGNK